MLVSLRPLTAADTSTLYTLAYTGDREWMRWDAPYFGATVPDRADFLAHPPMATLDYVSGILIDGQLSGIATAYYTDDPLQRWLECGLLLYRAAQWGQGVGSLALRQWTTQLFRQVSVPHIGLTTWSGNVGMMRAAIKAGYQEEGRLRQVRYWQGQYWDSMKYGVLRDEWRPIDD